MLLEEFDANKTAIINPDMCVEKIENFPEVTISCFSEELFNEVLEFFRAKEIASVHSASGLNPIYEVTYKGKRFAMFKSMVGEPLCVGQYEEIIAMGSKRLILLGNCGVLDKRIEDCGIIIPIKAVRDEGTSYHYAKPCDTIDVNHNYRDEFKKVLKEFGYPYVEGITWTTDACYRETRDKVNKRKEMGAVCVEMECAGMQHSVISGEQNFSSSFMQEITLTIHPGSQEVYQAVQDWMIRVKSCYWPLNLVLKY